MSSPCPPAPAAAGPPVVVLSGCTREAALVARIAAAVDHAGARLRLPDSPDLPEDPTSEDLIAARRVRSRRQMDAIADPATIAVVVANTAQDGRPNHVEPSALAEIAVAFAHRVPVFLLHGLPLPYLDELTAWDVVCLHADLDRLGALLTAA